MNDPTQILDVTMQAGELLLKNGAEVFRVQQTMEIMARAYGAEDYHVYVLTNGIFATLGTRAAKLQNVPVAGTHLGRVDAVNSLSRRIAAGQVTLEEAFAELRRIEAIPPVRMPLQVAACGFGAAFFALIFGGGWMDFACAFPAGVLLQLFLWQAETHNLNKIITRLLGAALVTAVGGIGVAMGIGQDLDKIIIGSIMPLTPGIALTMAIRDFFNSDYLSGTIRLMDALIIGLSIACGVGAVLTFAQYGLGVSL